MRRASGLLPWLRLASSSLDNLSIGITATGGARAGASFLSSASSMSLATLLSSSLPSTSASFLSPLSPPRGFSSAPTSSSNSWKSNEAEILDSSSSGNNSSNNDSSKSSSTSTSSSTSSSPLSSTSSSSNNTSSSSNNNNISIARDILDHAAVVHFRDLIAGDLASRKLSVSQRELEDEALAAGAASDRRAAADLVAALHASGFILRHRGTCFLRPDEIAEQVLRALPDSQEEVGERLGELRAELAPLEQAKRRVEARARRRTRAVLVGGFCLLVSQMSVFMYLTFGSPHYGWDLTEPYTYFSGQAITLLAYAYYLTTRRTPTDYSSVEEQLRDRFSASAAALAEFDRRKYERLRDEVSRYERYSFSTTTRSGGSERKEKEKEEFGGGGGLGGADVDSAII